MKFDASEVSSIEDLGELDGDKVKAVNLKGGLTIAVRSAGDNSQVLASASHIGILRHAMTKSMKGFRAGLMKSEKNEPTVTDYTNLLPSTLSKTGYGLYAIHKNNSETEFSITRHSITEFSLTGLAKSESIELGKLSKQSPLVAQISIALGKAAAKEAVVAGKEFIEFGGKKFEAKKLAE